MASSESTLLKLELQATGENDDTWGTKANAVFERLEEAIAGKQDVTITTTTVTLTDTAYDESEARKLVLNLSGTLSGSQDVVVPARTKMYLVYNGTTATSGETVTVKTAGGTGVEVPNGEYSLIYCDGTNVVNIFDPSTTLLATNSLSDLTSASDARTNLGLGTVAIEDIGTSGDTVPKNNTLNIFSARQALAKGSDITASASISLPTDGNYFDITGTASISGITAQAGTPFTLQFGGAASLVHSANLVLPGATDIVAVAGDHLIGFMTASNVAKVVSYLRADGSSISGGGGKVVQHNKTIDTTNRSTSSTSFTASGVSVALANDLADAGNSVRIRVTGMLGHASNGGFYHLTLHDGTSTIHPSGVNAFLEGKVVDNGNTQPFTLEFVTDPGTVTPKTYSLHWKTSGATLYLGRRGSNTDFDVPTIMTIEELDNT